MGVGIIKTIYRAIKYGRQVGKAANNGAAVYKRGRTITGLNKNGDVISTLNKGKTSPNTTRTFTETNLPGGYVKQSTVARTTDEFDESVHVFKYTVYKDRYGIIQPAYNKPHTIEMSGTKGQGIRVTTDTPVLKNNQAMNMRTTFEAKY